MGADYRYPMARYKKHKTQNPNPKSSSKFRPPHNLLYMKLRRLQKLWTARQNSNPKNKRSLFLGLFVFWVFEIVFFKNYPIPKRTFIKLKVLLTKPVIIAIRVGLSPYHFSRDILYCF